MTPEQLLYTPTHEWIFVEQDPSGASLGTVGLSAFALEALTDLVFLELPAVGQAVRAGKRLGEVESVKAVSDIYSPVDGEVVAANAEATKNLEHLADDPYDAGWLVKIRISDAAALKGLMDYAAYRKQCEKQMREE